MAVEFPDSAQVRRLALDQASDRIIWDYAKENGFAIVTQDSDYAELAALLCPPPKVIWLRCGNQPTEYIAALLRIRREQIESFLSDENLQCLELF